MSQEELIEKALHLYKYKKAYYSTYQKDNKEQINKNQHRYLKTVYDNPEKHKEMKEKQKLYYDNVVKPKREAEKKKRLEEALLVEEH